MSLDDSERRHARRRIEHARDPETESTPRSADAQDAGETELERQLGLLGLDRLKGLDRGVALQLTRRSGHLRAFGRALRERVSFDDLPSRIRIRQRLAEDAGGVGEVSATDVGERRREIALEQVSDGELRRIADDLAERSDTREEIGDSTDRRNPPPSHRNSGDRTVEPDRQKESEKRDTLRRKSLQ